jgi:multidrug efflux pump subunit AcrA (membrane-fusion protein)
VLVQEGDKVVEGQVLARQEDDDSRLSRNRVAAQLSQAEAQLPILEVQLDAAIREEARLKRLTESDAASTQAYEQAQDRTRQLQAQVEAQRSPPSPSSAPSWPKPTTRSSSTSSARPLTAPSCAATPTPARARPPSA